MQQIRRCSHEEEKNSLPSIAISRNICTPLHPTTKTSHLIQRKKNDFGKRKRIYIASKAGQDEYGRTKVNQDSFAVLNLIFDNSNYDIIGVFDGHGVNGHKVSQLISSKVSSFFTNVSNFSSTDVTAIYSKLTRHDSHFLTSFITSLQNTLIYSNFDIHFSGSTFLLLFILNNRIITTNIGDSRAILISDNSIESLNGGFSSEGNWGNVRPGNFC